MITKSVSVLLALATLASLQTTTAQGGQGPLPVSGAAFAKNSAVNKFFVLGGLYNNNPIGQFWSLDLAAAWNTSQPAWQQLADGPIQNIFPAVFSADGKSMATFHSGGTTFAFLYTVATNTWKQSQLTPAYAGFQGVSAVTDPNTGLVYLPGSYTDSSRNSMNVYNFDTDTMVQVALPSASSIFPDRAYYSIAWSQKRMSALIFGGYNATLGAIPGGYDTVTEFVPASGTWSNLVREHIIRWVVSVSFFFFYFFSPHSSLPSIPSPFLRLNCRDKLRKEEKTVREHAWFLLALLLMSIFLSTFHPRPSILS